MKIIDSTGEMDLENDCVASTDDMNYIAGAMLSEDGFERFCSDSPEILEGDDCQTVVEKIRAWADPSEIIDGAILGA